jgi:outer membrane protein assembly factor BamB
VIRSIHLSLPAALAIVFALSSCAYPPRPGRDDAGRENAFWGMRHRDGANRSWIETDGPAELEPAWSLAPDTPIGTYVAVWRDRVYTHSYNADDKPVGPNAGCRLWALDPASGRVLWCRRAVGAVLTSLAVDRHGNVYVSDSERLMAFAPDGSPLWQVDVEAPTSSVMLYPHDRLLVVDYRGHVNLYRARDGARDAEPFRLPAAPYPTGELARRVSPGLVSTGVAATFVPEMIAQFFGYGYVVKDVPAIDDRGDIYVAANDETGAAGKLWALALDRDAAPARWQVRCAAAIGPGSDTSPSLSHDEATAYVADGDGRLFAVSTSDCGLRWSLDIGGKSATSPAVAPDGTIYMLANRKLIAVRDRGNEAQLSWTADAASIAAEFGLPGGVFDSVALIAGRYLYVTASLGHPQRGFHLPVRHCIVVLDRKTGVVISTSELGEESDSTISMDARGWLFVPTKALARGHGLTLRAEDRLDAAASAVAIAAPSTGVYAFRPRATAETVRESLADEAQTRR